MYLENLQNWLVYGHSLLIFFNFCAILTYWNGSNLGFQGIFWRTHGGNGLTFCLLMYLDHLQNWLVLGHGLLTFVILALFWLSETGQIWGFRAFPGECMEGMAWNMVCCCILTTSRTDSIMVTVWWFLAATKQLYDWYFLSVCPSVCPSVTPFGLCSHHRIIMKFLGVITWDQGKVHAKGQRSKVKVTEVTTQLNRFRTVTPVWIHIWWWNGTYSLMLLRRGALLFFKVIRQISRSQGAKNRRIWPRLVVSGL